ncbi:hypothetical protein PPACK8108_LOCUS12574, partial [Phakopsora pachyrhizi]
LQRRRPLNRFLPKLLVSAFGNFPQQSRLASILLPFAAFALTRAYHTVGKFTASLFLTTCGEGFIEVPECLVEAKEPPGEVGCSCASFYPVKLTTP